ncbi:MAG: TetR family transcriptional regulator C-terminal domain-containing protein [Flavobacteriaceae bacterium]
MIMTPKKEKLSPDILSLYMQQTLAQEAYPTSVYKFCKENEIDEADFYKNYASLETIKQNIWQVFFDNTLHLLHKDKNYSSHSPKDRLLTFYYTFFEVLLLNRSYVLFALESGQSPMKYMAHFKHLRLAMKTYATELIEEGNEQKSRFTQNPVELFSEATWGQLFLLIKFWLKDSSKGFEKTDALIEKSVTVAFEVFDNTRLDSLLDLGKFLWKETTAKA